MKKIYFIACLFSLLCVQVITAQNFGWAKAFGSTDSKVIGVKIAIDSSGNVYSMGTFTGTVDFDPGAGTTTLNSQDNNTFYLSKLDSSGNFLWVKLLGPQSDRDGTDLTVDENGFCYVVGEYSSGSDLDPGPNTYTLSSQSISAFVLKLDPAGNFIWAKLFTGNGVCVPESVCLDQHHNIITTGVIQATIDVDPGPGTYYLTTSAPTHPAVYTGYNFFICKLDSNGQFLSASEMLTTYGQAVANTNNEIVSLSILYAPANHSMTITKLNGGLGTVWEKNFPADVSNCSIATDKYNHICAVGKFSGIVDFDPGLGTYTLNSNNGAIFVMQLDDSGNFKWAKQLMLQPWMLAIVDEFSHIINTDSQGNIYIAGIVGGTAYFDNTVPNAFVSTTNYAGFILKLDTNGNYKWVRHFENSPAGTSSSEIVEMKIDRFDNLYTTGYFAGTPDFDPGADTFDLTSAGSSGAFVHKLSSQQLVLLGLEERTKNTSLLVYPNPSQAIVHLQVARSLTNATCRLLSINGSLLQKKQNINGVSFHIDLSELPQGLYLLELQDGEKISRVKLLKE